MEDGICLHDNILFCAISRFESDVGIHVNQLVQLVIHL